MLEILVTSSYVGAVPPLLRTVPGGQAHMRDHPYRQGIRMLVA